MCGIAGFAGRVHSSDATRVADMAMIHAGSHGQESSGVLAVFGQEGPVIAKSLLLGWHLVDRDEWSSFRDRLVAPLHKEKGCVFACHGRQSTHGAITMRNCHPFHYGDIYLMHNGIIQNPDELAKGQKWEVDSETVAMALSREVPERACEVLRTVGGWAKLIWWDNRTRLLYTYGVDLIQLDDGLAFSSVPWMATSIASACGESSPEVFSSHSAADQLIVYDPRACSVVTREEVPLKGTRYASYTNRFQSQKDYYRWPTDEADVWGDDWDFERWAKEQDEADRRLMNGKIEVDRRMDA